MANATSVALAPAVPSIPLRALMPWLVLFVLVGATTIYFVASGQSTLLHEFVHDGRHLLGYPCH